MSRKVWVVMDYNELTLFVYSSKKALYQGLRYTYNLAFAFDSGYIEESTGFVYRSLSDFSDGNEPLAVFSHEVIRNVR